MSLPQTTFPPAALSEEQRRAVMAERGPLLILAGAGSGKTRVLTHRMAHLLSLGTEGLLLMTFTTAAARQMVARASLLVQDPSVFADRVWAGTFHHIALRILRHYGGLLGLPPAFGLLDPKDAADLLKNCTGKRPLPREMPSPEYLVRLLSLSVNREETLETVLHKRAPALLPLLADLSKIYDEYTASKLRLGVLDLDDLLLYFRLLLYSNPPVQKELSQRFRHILVDEYQDVSPLQAALCDQLAKDHQSLTVVGDDAQAIYGFRGAEVDNILSFPRRWPQGQVVTLRDNYRSTAGILTLATRSILHNRAQFHKEMRPVREQTAPRSRPLWGRFASGATQAAFVAQRIQGLLTEGVAASEIAVLYRGHNQALEVQMEFLRQRLPYRLNSGPRLLASAHIKDVLAFLRIIDNRWDAVSWQRVLGQMASVSPKIRKLALLLVAEGQQDGWSFVELLRRLYDAHSRLHPLVSILGDLVATRPSTPRALLQAVVRGHYAEYARATYPDFEQRLVQIERFSEQLRGADLSEMLAEMLISQASGPGQEEEDRADRVVLSTVHRAKGLEWSVVFLIWLTEGRFPALGYATSLEEERRLFYVGVTRARDQLYLCSPQYGERPLAPSRFLRELEGDPPLWDLI